MAFCNNYLSASVMIVNRAHLHISVRRNERYGVARFNFLYAPQRPAYHLMAMATSGWPQGMGTIGAPHLTHDNIVVACAALQQQSARLHAEDMTPAMYLCRLSAPLALTRARRHRADPGFSHSRQLKPRGQALPALVCISVDERSSTTGVDDVVKFPLC